VEKVDSGYAGGSTANPSYEEVSSGRTGHAEAVQLIFDANVISFREILEIFLGTHDPTTMNRQGLDTGTQYRSVIFYHDKAQKATAESMIDELNREKIWDRPIVTQIVPFKVFYKAEDYHKDYYAEHPESSYCKQIITPKIARLRERYLSKLKWR
jgi:peptide-methionine (S)-S-oxide reductase